MKTENFYLLWVLACLMPFSMIFGQSSTFTRVYYDLWIPAQGYGIVAMGDGNYVIAGIRDNRAMVAGFNDIGELLWMKQCQATYSRFQCLANTHDGGIMTAGYKPGTTGDELLFLLKTDLNGDTVFSRVFETGGTTIVQSIQPTTDHGFILCGWQDLTVSPNRALFVAKADSAGHMSWFRRYHSFYSAFGFSARQAADGGYLVAGGAPGSTPFQESAIFMKLSPSGDLIWCKDVQTGTGSRMNCNDLVETPDGLLLLVNSSNYEACLVNTDPAGNYQSSVRLNHQFTPYWEDLYPRPGIMTISDNRYLLTTPSWGGDDGLLVVDQTGIPVYENSLQITTADVALRPDHGFMVLGNGPIYGVMMANVATPQIGLMATDSTGATISCAYQLMPFSTSNVFITPDYPINSYPVTTSEVSTPLMEPASLSFWDGCVAVTGDIGVEIERDISLIVSPNPNSGEFVITLQGAGYIEGTIEINNVQGKKVFQSIFDSGNHFNVRLPGVADGIYFISILTDKGIFRQKTVVLKP